MPSSASLTPSHTSTNTIHAALPKIIEPRDKFKGWNRNYEKQVLNWSVLLKWEEVWHESECKFSIDDFANLSRCHPSICLIDIFRLRNVFLIGGFHLMFYSCLWHRLENCQMDICQCDQKNEIVKLTAKKVQTGAKLPPFTCQNIFLIPVKESKGQKNFPHGSPNFTFGNSDSAGATRVKIWGLNLFLLHQKSIVACLMHNGTLVRAF